LFRVHRYPVSRTVFLCSPCEDRQIADFCAAVSVRVSNCLRRGGVHTLAEATALSDEALLQMRGFGRKALAAVRSAS
jgi:DNA-directed RNA polymerase alpha subunit